MRIEENPSKIVLNAAEMIAAGFILALPGFTGVTILHHRKYTHRSVDVDPAYEAFIAREMRVYSPIPELWADVHRNHHRYSDSSLAPFMRIARAIDWMETNPRLAEGVRKPESYRYLDPKVDSFSKEDVLVIGHSAEADLRERVGEICQPPVFYTREQLQNLLNPTKPKYFYSRHKGRGNYTQEEMEDRLLRDPHSPLLVPDKNGVRAVLFRNVFLYSELSHMLRDVPELRSKDLKVEGKEKDYKLRRIEGFVDGTLQAAQLVHKFRNRYGDKNTPEDVAKALVVGLAINFIKLGFHLAGGNITNSYGHAGEMTPTSVIHATFDEEYNPVINADGTVSTDSVNGGVLGKAISAFTFDEVGGQGVHHENPWRIAYTKEIGIKGVTAAWWGKTLEVLANDPDFPYIKPGKGFSGVELNDRPDMPNPGVLLIQQRRAEQLRIKQELYS